MMWIITTIVLGCVAVLTLIYNAIKDAKINALEYEVGYLLYTIFEKDLPKRELDDEDIRKIKDELDKRMKQVEKVAEVNKYVRKLRKEKGVTQSLISKQTGISLSLISKFDNSKCNISESKLSKIIMMLSSDDDEFKKHSQLIYESFGLQLSNSYSSYGLATYDFNDIDKLAKTFTYGNKPLYDSDITAIKQIAKTLAYKN